MLRFALALAALLAVPALAFGQTTQYAPSDPDASPNQAGHELVVEAKLTDKGDTIERGLVWRVFADKTDDDGKLPLVATAEGGTHSFTLPAGVYLVHAAFGRAGATKRVTIANSGASETMVLDAGGLKLNAVADGHKLQDRFLRFSIYGLASDEDADERELIARNVTANRVVRLSAGTYHVVSTYGSINTSVTADLEVAAGQVTEATLQQRGAVVQLKFVSRAGGDPIANSAWTILAGNGEKLFESNNLAPVLVLAEGLYEASVRNGGEVHVKNFEVKSGQDVTVEVLLQ